MSGILKRLKNPFWVSRNLLNSGQWMIEQDGQFDVVFTWCGRPYLLEYQRTPITSKQLAGPQIGETKEMVWSAAVGCAAACGAG